jgi:hypothetical protein
MNALDLRLAVARATGDAPPPAWGAPDMEALRLHRRPPPTLPIEVFGSRWGEWIRIAAEAAGCPLDYVVAPLLASASALIGHARWAQAAPGWAEPPYLWIGGVGDSGNGKSPGADCLMRDVLPELERRMLADFPDRLREWRASVELTKAKDEAWKQDVRDAQRRGSLPPLPPVAAGGPEPQAPRLRQADVTIERVATLLATAAPKGLLIVRDELAAWVDGMAVYNPAGRGFWVEAYGGRPYRVERQKHPEPIDIPRLAVAVYGTTQPDRLALLMRYPDDGLLARVLWVWPEPIPFRLGRSAPGAPAAIRAFDRLRELDLQPGDPPSPIMVPLTNEARTRIETFGGLYTMRHSSGPPPIVSQSVKSVTAPPERPAASAKEVEAQPEIDEESGVDPASWRDLFEERAAIRQFDGGCSRADAERLAWGELQTRWLMTHGERVPRHLCAGCRRPVGDADALDLIDGNRVHDAAGHDCLIRWGERWRGAATRALVAMGLPLPAHWHEIAGYARLSATAGEPHAT